MMCDSPVVRAEQQGSHHVGEARAREARPDPSPPPRDEAPSRPPLAACWPSAQFTTLPLDTAKVRLQVQKGGAGGALKYNGLVGTIGTIAREEGAGALWKGLAPGLHRQCLYGGLRIGLYDPIKKMYQGDAEGAPTLGVKIAAALTTGALAITVANPTDLVKVRMQTQPKPGPGEALKYPSATRAYGIIAKTEGVGALWTGLGPNVGRNSIINAAELASYDQIKEALLAAGMADGPLCHVSSAVGAGFCAVIVGSPVDVVKSRVMGDKEGRYKGVLDCFRQTAADAGLAGFYKGFVPNFGRLAAWNTVMFLTLEQLKKLAASALAE